MLENKSHSSLASVGEDNNYNEKKYRIKTIRYVRCINCVSCIRP